MITFNELNQFFVLMLLFLLIYPLNTQALSASTANTIEGTKPYLLLADGVTQLTDLNDLLGFSMPKKDGSGERESIDVSMATTPLISPKGMTYSDVVALVAADGIAHQLSGVIVGDDDGDASIVSNTLITGTMKATWYEGTTPVPASNLGNKLTACGGPYKLKLEIPTEVSANTTYGAPNTTLYGTNTGVTYTFTPDKEICYFKPLNMQYFNNSVGATYAQGYNPETYTVNLGFKVNSGFPTTGFEKAVFSVIGAGFNQSKYRCSSVDDGGKISLSGAASAGLGGNCTVTYNAETKSAFTVGGTPTIKMEYNISSTAVPNWVEIDSYTIPIPAKWAIGKGVVQYANNFSLADATQFPALDVCREVPIGTTTWQEAAGQNTADRVFRQQFMYRRDELTNGAPAYVNENSSPTIMTNYMVRDVGTFMGEWGYMQSYKGSAWEEYNRYWTAEAWSSVYQFDVNSIGRVNFASPISDNYISLICRGE